MNYPLTFGILIFHVFVSIRAVFVVCLCLSYTEKLDFTVLAHQNLYSLIINM